MASLKIPTVYIESSVISYYTNEMSNFLEIAAAQKITHEWWHKIMPKLRPYISPYVFSEISNGNIQEANKRKSVIERIEILTETKDVIDLARKYFHQLSLPKKAELDAFHLAIATVYNIDFLVSWNCKHIANSFKFNKIKNINNKLGFNTPNICIPTMMMEIE